MKQPVEEAITRIGGLSRMAEALGIKPASVFRWRERGVPYDRCPAVESHTGVRCDELRPDVTWIRDADGVVTGYQVPVAAPTDQAEAA